VKVSVQFCAGRLLLPGRLRGPFLSRPHASDRGPQRLGVSDSSLPMRNDAKNDVLSATARLGGLFR
jgi:hypothetical protein